MNSQEVFQTRIITVQKKYNKWNQLALYSFWTLTFLAVVGIGLVFDTVISNSMLTVVFTTSLSAWWVISWTYMEMRNSRAAKQKIFEAILTGKDFEFKDVHIWGNKFLARGSNGLQDGFIHKINSGSSANTPTQEYLVTLI